MNLTSLAEKEETMQRFLGQIVKVRLKSPSGAQVIWPLGKLVYNESKNKEGFYVQNGLGFRLKPYQLTGTSIELSGEKPVPMLSFDVGIQQKYLPITYDSIKRRLFSYN